MAIALVAIPFIIHAQSETFDIVTYRPFPGWKKQTTDFAVSYSTIDNVAGTWCQVAIYNSVASSGNPAADFSSEWKALVKPDTYAGAVEPTPTGSQGDGWTWNSGSSKFKWQGKDSYVMLLNISGYGKMVSIHIAANTDKHNKEVENFFNSIQVQKPQQAQASATTQTTQATQAVQTTQSTSAPAKAITVTSKPGISGIELATTNFDDGWVAQPFADYVMVTKQPVVVLLHYAIEIDDDMRRADNMALALWDKMIANRYRFSNLKVFQNEPYTYFKTYFAEAEAVDLSTNKPCYIGFRVLIASGIARAIEIVAPTATAFQKEFPDQAKIESMINYNKFAVSPKDLVGTWEESSSTGVNMYNTVTGAYAGMNASAMANSFEFRSDGSYHSNHKGAYGMVGSMNFYDQKYDGKYTLTNWDVTMTNRFKGKTDIYWCQYEAVRGGRMLLLRDKSASAMTYNLVKAK